jgi:hypothetical protein
MKRTLYIASGVSVVFSTLAFAHIMEHHISHEIADHRENLAQCLIAGTIAAVIVVLSLIGAYFLLTGWRRQN